MDVENPQKTYLVKNWEVCLKSGVRAEYNIREDRGDSYTVERPWCIWKWPSLKRESKILETEIAMINYYEAEFKELPAYKPKKGANAQTKEVSRPVEATPERPYVPSIKADKGA